MSEIEINQQNSKKTRLGRGLGSLLGGAGVDLSAPPAPTPAPPKAAESNIRLAAPATIDDANRIWMIAIDKLRVNAQQPRQVFQPEALEDLKKSIVVHGVLQPIVAQKIDDKTFEIIAGERRWRAAQAAGLHQVPVVIKKVTNQTSLEIALIENLQRENLNPIEEAEAIQDLIIEYNLTQQQAADRLGKDRVTIANLLRLLMLSPFTKKAVQTGSLSHGHAKVLLGIESHPAQDQLAKKTIEERLSVRVLEQLVQAYKKEKPGLAPQKLNMDVSARLAAGMSEELQKAIGTKVAIDYKNGKGKLQIAFYSDEQLSQIVERLRDAWKP